MSGPKISFSRRRPIPRSLSPEATPGHRRHDRDLVPGADFRVQAGTEAYVFVVQVHVDKLTQLTALIEQPVLEAGIPGVQRLDRRAEISGLDVNRRLTLREAAQWAGNAELSHF